jgi:hypothetical protein
MTPTVAPHVLINGAKTRRVALRYYIPWPFGSSVPVQSKPSHYCFRSDNSLYPHGRKATINVLGDTHQLFSVCASDTRMGFHYDILFS